MPTSSKNFHKDSDAAATTSTTSVDHHHQRQSSSSTTSAQQPPPVVQNQNKQQLELETRLAELELALKSVNDEINTRMNKFSASSRSSSAAGNSSVSSAQLSHNQFIGKTSSSNNNKINRVSSNDDDIYGGSSNNNYQKKINNNNSSPSASVNSTALLTPQQQYQELVYSLSFNLLERTAAIDLKGVRETLNAAKKQQVDLVAAFRNQYDTTSSSLTDHHRHRHHHNRKNSSRSNQSARGGSTDDITGASSYNNHHQRVSFIKTSSSSKRSSRTATPNMIRHTNPNNNIFPGSPEALSATATPLNASTGSSNHHGSYYNPQPNNSYHHHSHVLSIPSSSTSMSPQSTGSLALTPLVAPNSNNNNNFETNQGQGGISSFLPALPKFPANNSGSNTNPSAQQQQPISANKFFMVDTNKNTPKPSSLFGAAASSATNNNNNTNNSNNTGGNSSPQQQQLPLTNNNTVFSSATVLADMEGQTPLHLIASKKKRTHKTTKDASHQSSRNNKKNKDDDDVDVENNILEIAKILVQYGFSVESLDDHGATPVDVARNAGNDSVAEVMILAYTSLRPQQGGDSYDYDYDENNADDNSDADSSGTGGSSSSSSSTATSRSSSSTTSRNHTPVLLKNNVNNSGNRNKQEQSSPSSFDNHNNNNNNKHNKSSSSPAAAQQLTPVSTILRNTNHNKHHEGEHQHHNHNLHLHHKGNDHHHQDHNHNSSSPQQQQQYQISSANFRQSLESFAEERLYGVIILVGLPARGKTYFARRVERFFMFKGAEVASFSAGEVRRILYPGVGRAEVTDEQLEKISDDVAKKAARFMSGKQHQQQQSSSSGGGNHYDESDHHHHHNNSINNQHQHQTYCSQQQQCMAIIDGLNHSRALRSRLFGSLCSHGVPPTSIIFLEVVVTDDDVVERHIKTAVTDYVAGSRKNRYNIHPGHFGGDNDNNNNDDDENGNNNNNKRGSSLEPIDNTLSGDNNKNDDSVHRDNNNNNNDPPAMSPSLDLNMANQQHHQFPTSTTKCNKNSVSKEYNNETTTVDDDPMRNFGRRSTMYNFIASTSPLLSSKSPSTLSDSTISPSSFRSSGNKKPAAEVAPSPPPLHDSFEINENQSSSSNTPQNANDNSDHQQYKLIAHETPMTKSGSSGLVGDQQQQQQQVPPLSSLSITTSTRKNNNQNHSRKTSLESTGTTTTNSPGTHRPSSTSTMLPQNSSFSVNAFSTPTSLTGISMPQAILQSESVADAQNEETSTGSGGKKKNDSTTTPYAVSNHNNNTNSNDSNNNNKHQTSSQFLSSDSSNSGGGGSTNQQHKRKRSHESTFSSEGTNTNNTTTTSSPSSMTYTHQLRNNTINATSSVEAEDERQQQQIDDQEKDRQLEREFRHKYRNLIAQMEEKYETMDPTAESGLCFARSLNRTQLICHNLAYTPIGRTLSRLLMDIHETERTYYFAAIGETVASKEGRFGVFSSPLSADGEAYAERLAAHLLKHHLTQPEDLIENTTILTCSSPAGRKTVAPLVAKLEHQEARSRQVRYLHTLDDLNYGDCDGMTEKEVQEMFPRHFSLLKSNNNGDMMSDTDADNNNGENKNNNNIDDTNTNNDHQQHQPQFAASSYSINWPRGESFEMMMQVRIEQHISELEAQTQKHIIVVVPVAVLQALLLYFDHARYPSIRPEEAVNRVVIPKGHMICLSGNDRQVVSWEEI